MRTRQPRCRLSDGSGPLPTPCRPLRTATLEEAKAKFRAAWEKATLHCRRRKVLHLEPIRIACPTGLPSASTMRWCEVMTQRLPKNCRCRKSLFDKRIAGSQPLLSKCVRPLADITTDDEGVGIVSFAFP